MNMNVTADDDGNDGGDLDDDGNVDNDNDDNNRR